MNKMMINNILVGIIIIAIMVLAFFVIKPILISIAFGLIFAYIFYPVQRKINKTIKNRTLSASILMFFIAIVVIAPAVYFTPALIEQVFKIFEEVRKINIAEAISLLFPFVDPSSTAYSLLQNLNNLPGKIVSSFTDFLFSMIVNLPSLLLQTFVFLFTFFFTVRDADLLKDYFADISPFSKSTEKRFMREFRGITNSIILGQVLIGILQGVTLGLGLWFLGVPNVILWTIITTIVSIIPIVGPWLVWVPIAGFLFLTGEATSGIILALYGGLFVSNIDNIVRPYLLSKSSHLPVVISLIGTIGGLYFLGIVGLVLGPLILAYALIIIDFYREGRIDELYKETKHGIANYEIKS